MCPRRGTKICPLCKDARYCSTDCQKCDWKVHKILCPTFNPPKPELTRSDGFHRRVLLFPGHDQKARFVWVEFWADAEESDSETSDSETTDIFDADAIQQKYFDGGITARTYFSNPNPIQAREMMRSNTKLGLHMFCLSMTLSEPPNLGLRAFTRGQACAPNYSGPILVLRRVDHVHNYLDKYVDVDMRDARHAADQFTWECRDSCIASPHLSTLRVLATVCCSGGEVTRLDLRSKFNQLVVDGQHTIFGASGSGIANLLGLLLFLRRSNRPYHGENHHNREAMLLTRDITSTTFGGIPIRDQYFSLEFRGIEGFGSSPLLWSSNTTGSILVARADGLPLFKQHIQALCNYIEQRIEPKLARSVASLSAGDTVPQREAILDSITKADFLDFFHTMKVEQEAIDDRWQGLPSPYDVIPTTDADNIEAMWRVQERIGVNRPSGGPVGLNVRSRVKLCTRIPSTR